MAQQKLIITADDYGAHALIDDAINYAVQMGWVTAVSAFANGPKYNGLACVDRVKILQDVNPNISVGLHLTITSGKPLSPVARSLIRKRGKYKGFFKGYTKQHPNKADEQELFGELKAQVDAFHNAGITIKHFSDHHGFLSHTDKGMRCMLAVVEYYEQISGVKASVRNPYFISYHVGEEISCLDRSVMAGKARIGIWFRNLFICKAINKFKVDPESAEKRLFQIHQKGIPTTDYFIESLYGKGSRKMLKCILEHAPKTRYQYKNAAYASNVPVFLDDITSEVVVHLAIVPEDVQENPVFQKNLKDLEKNYFGIATGYLQYRRGKELRALGHLNRLLKELNIDKQNTVRSF